MKEVEEASPDHYPRLLLYRLLETQKCLYPLIKHPALAPLRAQYTVNESTLQEIKSWLEAQGGTFHPGGSSPAAPTAERLGVVFAPQGVTTRITGDSSSPFAAAARYAPHLCGPSEEASSPSSAPTPAPSPRPTRTPLIFQMPSSRMKPASPLTGTTDDSAGK